MRILIFHIIARHIFAVRIFLFCYIYNSNTKASESFSCNPLTLNTISGHADEFIKQIKEDGALVGTADVHLVGHSMGGLDGRMVLKNLPNKIIRFKSAKWMARLYMKT